MKPINVNLGCGHQKKEGFINIDCRCEVKPDVVSDIRCGLDFQDNSVDELHADEVLEHFPPDEVDKIMHEIHRVMKQDGLVIINVPHFTKSGRSYLHYWGADRLWLKRDYNEYNPSHQFMLHSVRYKYAGYDYTFLDAILNRIKPLVDKILGYWIGGIENVEFILTPIKQAGVREENSG